MKANFSRRIMLAGIATATVLQSKVLWAESQGANVVEMLNKHPDNKKLRMLFSPRLIAIEAGDSVLFQAVDRGHNSASMKGMIPEGASPWKGKIGKDIEVKFDIPGFYGYVCTPHATMGMVGMVVVKGPGMMDNLEASKAFKHRGKAKAVFKEIWQEADDMGLLN